ncbi:multiple resistance and pH regulation protein F [Candidatus Fermentibacteria bacterium]|nr:multiple resistance and pH regulation protein F [Candidatus Fermentibacteria bacterium]
MRFLRWFLGFVVLGGLIALIIARPAPAIFYPDLPHTGFVVRALYILLLAGALCMYRIIFGPTAADRIVAIDIIGILIVGFCAIVSIATNRTWYVDVGIAWALQSFISTLALSKHLEGKGFDE